MDSDPLFSVVIPTYNRGALILKTLESVFRQTYQHYEIIVVDDCSTDNTEQILEPLVESGKIRVIKHEENYERAHARNTGMENARGDYLTFLDSDDLMYSTNLEDATTYTRQNPDIRIFHNQYQLVDAEDNVLCQFAFPALDNQILAITAGNFMGCQGDFIQREIYQKYRFDTNPALKVSEDWLFWLKILADYKLGRINKINSAVVFHGDRSIMRLDLPALHAARTYLIEALTSDPHLNKIYGKHLKRIEAASLLYASTVANLMRQHGQALKCLLRAASLDPRLVGSINFIKAFGIAALRINKGH